MNTYTETASRTETASQLRPSIDFLIYLSLGSTLGVIIVYAIFARWKGLHLHIDPAKVAGMMAPLLLAASFIERAVEVIISPWRDTEANQLSNTLHEKRKHAQTQAAIAAASGAESATTNHAAAASAAASAADELNEYKGKTKQYAFALSLVLGLSVAFVGVRALVNFYDPTAPSPFESANQQLMFNVVDVFISAAVLAGGANGMHSIINGFTTFFDVNAKKIQNADGSL
jgi:phage tail sheath gpL-like